MPADKPEQEEQMEYKNREYPLFSACGLNCGLCPRHYADGKSKCPGCAGADFSKVHPSCGVLSCCQRKGIEYCFLCDEFPCKKYDGADLHDSFITHKNQFTDLEKAKHLGMEAYRAELNEKISLLAELLNNYDDGRRKSLFCLAVNLLDLHVVRSIVAQLADSVDAGVSPKEKTESAVCMFNEAAEIKGVSLKLRKNKA